MALNYILLNTVKSIWLNYLCTDYYQWIQKWGKGNANPPHFGCATHGVIFVLTFQAVQAPAKEYRIHQLIGTESDQSPLFV